MTSARFAEDPVFGDVARALRPRGFDTSKRPAEAGDWLHVGFDSRGLSPTDRTALARLGPISVGGSVGGSTSPVGLAAVTGDGQRETLGSPRSALERITPRTAAIAALLAAHDEFSRPPGPVRLMGVVNVTPDSFSDAGRFLDPERAIQHGLALVDEGANLLDVGGESTRPGAGPLDADTELRRVVPVVKGLAARTRVPVSIDTTKAAVAEAALESGASIVNDISAGTFDPRMLAVVAQHRAGFVAMHMQGTPRDMQVDPRYGDVVTEVVEFLRGRVRAGLEAGLERSSFWIDPGIGFGKCLEHNLELLVRLDEMRSLGLTVCLGVSRKSFIAALEQRAGVPRERSDPGQRTGGTAAALTLGVWNGAEILRVHDVAMMKQAALVAEALRLRNRREERG